jgi:hypothetical protein
VITQSQGWFGYTFDLALDILRFIGGHLFLDISTTMLQQTLDQPGQLMSRGRHRLGRAMAGLEATAKGPHGTG